jgi:hypothetical protein
MIMMILCDIEGVNTVLTTQLQETQKILGHVGVDCHGVATSIHEILGSNT